MSDGVLYAVEGTTATAKSVFVDEFDLPLILSNTQSGPLVTLYDVDKTIIAEQYAIPDHEGDVGEWAANIPIPKMGISDRIELKLVWKFKTEDGDVYKTTQVCFVEPSDDNRVSDIVVVTGRDTHMQVMVPIVFKPGTPERPADTVKGIPAKPAVLGDVVRFSLYGNNIALYENQYLEHTDPSVRFSVGSTRTTFTLPAAVGLPKLEPLILLVEYSQQGAILPRTFSFKVWPITPQILVATSQIEDFINKARIENVIPELDYTQADLIQYLQRGLALFNGLAPHITSFNGTNMQGSILNSWLTCSSYYALASQLQAEGAMAFDFGGQSVNLNIDRTPSIESALGRVESAIDQVVKPFKKLLARAGVLSGDGSQGGGYIDGSRALGILSLTNAPTTRVPGTRNGSWTRPYT